MSVVNRLLLIPALIVVFASPAFAQAPPSAPNVPLAAAIASPSPAQQAAVLLGRWETCIDLAAQFLAYSALGARRSVANVERKCVEFEARLKPVLARSLADMMYGSSDQQVAEQAEAAVESLRRHLNARAVSAVARVRAR